MGANNAHFERVVVVPCCQKNQPDVPAFQLIPPLTFNVAHTRLMILSSFKIYLFMLKNFIWNPFMRTLGIPTRKEWPLRVELRRDASHGPNVDRRGVVGRSQEDFGGAVPVEFFK